jgi:hypothetical protein
MEQVFANGFHSIFKVFVRFDCICLIAVSKLKHHTVWLPPAPSAYLADPRCALASSRLSIRSKRKAGFKSVYLT